MTNLPKRQPQQSLISTALNSSCKTNTLFRPGFGSSCQELPKTRRQVWQELCHRSQLYLKSFPFQRPPADTAAGQSTSPDRPSSALFLFRRKSLKVRKGRTNMSWKLRTVFVLHYLLFFPYDSNIHYNNDKTWITFIFLFYAYFLYFLHLSLLRLHQTRQCFYIPCKITQ